MVDDHPVNVRVLTRQLRQWGLRVATADSGAAALDVLAQGALPDIIVTDMHMPGMDGLDLARHVRELPGGGAVPMVLLSSGFMPSGTDGTRLFNARLLKPARQLQLFETLARCLAPQAASAPQPASHADERKHVTVLVVDDNAVNLKVACGMLARLGYDTVTAADGVDAVAEVATAMAAGRSFGAVLMDLHMPRMDGLEATRVLQQRFGGAAPPVVALTADASAEDRERCAAAGMDDYLTKPLQVAAPVAGPVEGDGSNAMQFAIGTNHAFDGWVDKFVTTPANGLIDMNIAVNYTVASDQKWLNGTRAMVRYHDFRAEKSDTHYGNEWNVFFEQTIESHYTIGMQAGHYEADNFSTDTTKIMPYVQVKF